LPKRPEALLDPTMPAARASRAGRPTAARAAAIQRAILEAARQVFRTDGFDAASMESVAAAAGVSKGTLYARYPTKAALMRAVVDGQLAAWAAGRDRGPLPEDFKQRLQYHARSILESVASDDVRAFERSLRGASGPARELAKALYAAAHGQVVEDLTREIVQGTRDFPAPPRSPKRVAEMLLAMIYGWHAVHDPLREISREEAITYADHAVDVIFAGRSAW
jgi:AcrR family transcriptional regulator